MEEKHTLQMFEDKQIRTAWNEEEEEWYFSVVDVVGVLTEAADYDVARNYWKVMKMRSPKDGKKYNTDVANIEQLLRIIQSIPSPSLGGEVAGIARKALEERTGKSVITSKNAYDFRELITSMVEDMTRLPENHKEDE